MPVNGLSTAKPIGKLRIFLIEDHADTARAMMMYLQACGHEVRHAADAKAARASASEGAFDILLSDLRLPDGNGWDLLRELRRDHIFKAIAMSGHNTDEDRARSKAAGFLEHLPKPLVPEELDAAFARVMADGV
jgi:DNA-binding response OmpR family regulator